MASEVEGLRRACGDANRRKVAPHVTLIPPINLREEDVAGALAVVRDAAAACLPLALELGPATTFGDDGARTVLYLAVGGPDRDRLHGLQAALVAGPLERPPQHESIVPHVAISISLPSERVEAGPAHAQARAPLSGGAEGGHLGARSFRLRLHRPLRLAEPAGERSGGPLGHDPPEAVRGGAPGPFALV